MLVKHVRWQRSEQNRVAMRRRRVNRSSCDFCKTLTHIVLEQGPHSSTGDKCAHHALRRERRLAQIVRIAPNILHNNRMVPIDDEANILAQHLFI